jgi:glycosyltransferase involved in cell wall biosynthesis
MHVCQVMADGVPGGGPTIVQTLCTQLAARSIEVSVITQSESYLFEQATAAGWRTFGLDFSRRTAALRLSKHLHRIFRQTRPDVVHAHGSRSALPVALLAAEERPGFVYSIHGFHYRKKKSLSRVFFRTIERFCIGRADQVIVIAKGDENFAREQGLLKRPERWHLIYNGVDVPADYAVPDAARRYDIAFVGRLHPQKNPLILPDILVAMRPARPAMLVVGGGNLEMALRDKIAKSGTGEQITLEGAMPRAEALRRMAQARVFVLPSLWEGLPLALAEAMQLHVPVVASRVAGNEEIVRDGVTGFLADPHDPAAFADRIAALLDSVDLRQRIGACGARYAADAFSCERQVTEHLKLYESMATD